MRRLTVLPCPESWERMRPDGDGRFCERCRLRVTEVAKLDHEGLDQLAAAAEGGRVCARFELEGGRPRTKLGLAVGLAVIALAGCAIPDAANTQAPLDRVAFGEFVGQPLAEAAGGVIAGAVRTPEGLPLAGAIVVLQSTALRGQHERMTNERGFYKFEDLPPGNYTIQVLYGQASDLKITTLPEAGQFRAHFSIDPYAEGPEVMLGLVVEETMIDWTSPASTYSSRMLEYD